MLSSAPSAHGCGLLLLAFALLCVCAWSFVGEAAAAPPALGVPVRQSSAPVEPVAPDPDAAVREDAVTAPQRRLFADADRPGIAGRLLQDGRPLVGASVGSDDDELLAGRSDADGAFFLPQCRGRIQLQIAGATVPPGFTFGPIDLGEGDRCDVGEVIVPRPASITGRVLDEQGRPLAGITVFAAGRHSDVYPDRPTAVESSPSRRTGSDGRFQFGNLLPGGTRVHVDDPDREPGNHAGDAEVELASGECVDVGDLVVLHAEPLRGFVLDGSGQPIAGAQVTPGGGESTERQPRRAVRSGADGGFLVRGFGRFEALTIEREGFETLLCERVDEAARPFVARLRPALALAGAVHGSRGQPGYVCVEMDPADYREPSGWIWRTLYRPYPIGADGSFRIVGLPAGRWRVRAAVPRVGAADFVACELPQQEPLQLTLAPAREVTVQVVDDQGAPVGGADIDARCRYSEDDLFTPPPPRDGKEAVTDADGRARLWLVPSPAQSVHGSARGHCDDELELDDAAIPAAVTLTLPRAGHLRGTVPVAALRQRAHLWVGCAQQDGSERGHVIDIDSRGCFRSGPLRPGRYSLALVVADPTEQGMSWQPPVPHPTPVLGDRVQVGATVLVEVVAAVESTVDLPAPPVGEVRGRVLARGAPVAGALVYALAGDREAESYLLPVELQTSRGRVFCRTDEEGRFCFLAPAAGTFLLRARHARGACWSAPVVVCVREPGTSAAVDLRIGAAAIRGSFDTGALPPAEGGDVRACLYRLEDAAADPQQDVWTGNSRRRLQDTVQQLRPDRSGAFAFECLPPGGWLLRLVGSQGILLQRVVSLATDDVVELGPLQLPIGVAPRLRCGLGEHSGVQLLRLQDGKELFLRVVDNCGGEGFAWGVLPPGRYRLRDTEMLVLTTRCGSRTWTSWQAGEPVGEPVDVEVHADGTCTPAIVWPDGLAK